MVVQAAWEDADLVERAVCGDDTAFEELYRRHAGRLRGVLARRFGHAADVEDLTQTVFLKAWRAMPGFQPGRAPFFAWLRVIAFNEAVAQRRTVRYLLPLNDPAPDVSADQWEEDLVNALDAAAWLQTAWPRLRPMYQRVLFYRFFQGLDPAEVGERVGRSGAAVRVIQHRALAALRDMARQGAGTDGTR